MCLLETAKLINGIKSNNNRKFDYFNYIDLLIKDSIFANSSKCCVFLNHLLYCILSIITITKVFTIFFIEKYSFFNFINLYFDGKNYDKDENTNHYLSAYQPNDSFSTFNFSHDEIISGRKIIIFLIIFLIFIFSFVMYRFIKKLLNIFLFMTMITITFIILFNIFELKHSIELDKRISLFGYDYTYVIYFF